MGAMVEILCGVLSGALYSNKIRKWTHVGSHAEADLGQFFIAVNLFRLEVMQFINFPIISKFKYRSIPIALLPVLLAE